MKTVPVVDIDDNQDDDVQELAGGRPAAPGMDEPVAVSRPREPGDGIILLSKQRVAKNHLPVHIGPVKPDVIECETDEEEEKQTSPPHLTVRLMSWMTQNMENPEIPCMDATALSLHQPQLLPQPWTTGTLAILWIKRKRHNPTLTRKAQPLRRRLEKIYRAGPTYHEVVHL